MKFANILAFATLGSTSVLAIAIKPAPLVKRQSAARTCGATTYDVGSQEAAFNSAKDYETDKVTVRGTAGPAYPHQFNNNENLSLPDCPGVPAPFREFPILANGDVFAADQDPLTDRIVYKVTGTDPGNGAPDNFVFCGVITHTGASTRNGFVDCT